VFERMLALNPNDNQGVRFWLQDVHAGLTWDEAQARDELAEAEREEAARAQAAQLRRRSSAGEDPSLN